MDKRVSVLLASALIAIGTVQSPTLACGPFFASNDYVYTLHPDFPLPKFAKGNIGVLPKNIARSYMVAAWRYLNGAPLTESEQTSMVALWETRLAHGAVNTAAYGFSEDSDNSSQWIEFRKAIGKPLKDGNIFGYKYIDSGSLYINFLNCPSTAFEFAAKTGQQVSKEFGPNSKEFNEWIKGQDDVFCNCSGNQTKFPAPAEGLSPKFKAYRDYQIACAHFYGREYEKARAEFDKIAQDKDSPFSYLGSYLAVRSLVREATTQASVDSALLAEAEKRINDLLNKASTFDSALKALLSFVKFHSNTDSTLAELNNKLNSNASGANAGAYLSDYTFLYSNIIGEVFDDWVDMGKDPSAQRWSKHERIAKAGEMSDWILTMQTNLPEAKKHAISKWNQTHKLPWLIASMRYLTPSDAEAAKLMNEAKMVSASSPAYQHLQYELSRLLAQSKKSDEARAIIDKIFENKSVILAPSSKNYFINQRLMVCKSFAEFTRFALQRPSCVEAGGDAAEVPEEFEKTEQSKNYPSLEPAFTPATARFFSSAVPQNLLMSLLSLPLSKRLNADATQALWVRAFLLGDNAALNVVSPKLKALGPRFAAQLAVYEKASSQTEKNFAAALMILKNPGMRPYIEADYGRATPINEIDDYQNNWWNSADLKVPEQEEPGEHFGDAKYYLTCLNPKEKADGLVENKRLLELGPSSAALSKYVLAYWKTNPKDNRIPEALHLCVKASKFGEKNATSTKYSKECFQVLHRNFPKNTWTNQTEYYY